MDRITLLKVPFDRVNLNEAYQIFLRLLQEDSFHYIVTPNPEIVMKANKDEAFLNIIREADLSLPDGIGIVIGTKFKKEKITERVPGFDLTQEILKHAPEKGYKIFLMGSKPGYAEEAKENLESTYPGIQIVGTQHGYYQEQEEKEIVEKINASGADVLICAMGAPKQEKFMYRYKEELQPKVGIGVGGTIDILANKMDRAPEFYQKIGMEWFYRLVKEPVRIKRMKILPVFLWKAFLEKEKQ